MKHLILWGSILIAAILLGLLYEKVSVAKLAFEDLSQCPIYINVFFCAAGVFLVISRGYALFGQLFK